MDRWQAMRVFVKVAETGGFAGAARQLHMSPPSVTRVISGLEDMIGTRLLIRTTRTLGSAGTETHGGGDVMLGASGAGARSFKGSMDNTKVFTLLKSAFGF